MEAAIRLLARREHSAHELRAKLRRKGHVLEQIEAVLAALQEDGLQSDERYAELLVETRTAAGYGPLRIRHELQRAGVEAPLVDAALAPHESRWAELAEQARRRRFRGEVPKDHRERARQARFLHYRGFPTELIHAILSRGDALIDEW